jgi:hypothetical protein
MRTFVVACVLAALIATGAAFALNTIQESSAVAYSSTGVRI